MNTTWHILINPAAASGRGRKVWEKIMPVLKERGISYKQFFPATEDHAKEIIRKLEELTPVNLIVVGGDGTMGTVTGAITDFSRFSIGYIPAGSANDLALSLGLSHDPVENLSIILEGNITRRLDVGYIDLLPSPWGEGGPLAVDEGIDTENRSSVSASPAPHRFLVSSGIGFDAAVCAHVNESRLKKLLSKVGLSKLSYLFIALKILFTEEKTGCTITLDNGDVHRMDKAMFAAIMIERFEGGGFMFAPDADPSDGLFDLCMIGDISIPKFLTSLPKAKKGTHFTLKGATHALSSHVDIKADAPLYVHADGDVVAHTTHITLTCLKQALQMLN